MSYQNANVTGKLNSSSLGNLSSNISGSILSSNYVSYDPTYSFNTIDYKNIFNTFFKVLTENELTKILHDIKPRLDISQGNKTTKKINTANIESYNNIASFNNIIKAIVRNRHLSEKFLLEYLDILEVDDLMVNHSTEILDGEYSAIKLKISLN